MRWRDGVWNDFLAAILVTGLARPFDGGLTLKAGGDQVKLVPPQFVAKQRIGNKTDRNDADAIYAVHMDARVHPVPLKTPAQQDQLSLNHTRSFLVKLSTALSNHLRSLLAERGLVTAKGRAGLDQLVEAVTDIQKTPLSIECQPLVAVLQALREQLSTHVDTLDKILKAQVRASETALRLMEIPGVGPVTASAVSAEFPDVNRYTDARQFAAAIGLVPGEHSSGGKQRLSGISKRGNQNIRTLLTQGAQNIVNSACPSARKAPLATEQKQRPAKTDDIHEFAPSRPGTQVPQSGRIYVRVAHFIKKRLASEEESIYVVSLSNHNSTEADAAMFI